MHHGGTYDGSSHTYAGGNVNNIKNKGVVNGQMHYGGHFRGDRVGEREDTRYNTSEPHGHRSSSSHATQYREDNSQRRHRARKIHAPKSSTYGQRQDASSQSSYPMGHGPPAIYPRYAPQPQMNSHAPYPMSTPYAAPSYSAPSTYANHPTAYSNSSSPPSHNQGSWCSFLVCL